MSIHVPANLISRNNVIRKVTPSTTWKQQQQSFYTTTTAVASSSMSSSSSSSSSNSSVSTNNSGVIKLITIPTTNRIIMILLPTHTYIPSNRPSILYLPNPERAANSPGRHSEGWELLLPSVTFADFCSNCAEIFKFKFLFLPGSVWPCLSKAHTKTNKFQVFISWGNW